MRALLTLVASIALAMMAGACSKSISDTDYAREGIGVELSRSGLPAQTELQNLYLDTLCQQTSSSLVGGVHCTEVPPSLWPAIVQAGLNDIDLRCDAYLTWLDDLRRSSGPILQEITDTHTATEAIMAATGVGPKQIAIVGAAFGLAYNTFTNVNHRLLVDVDKTTVQAVVYGRRSKFRIDLAGFPPINNRPAAIHALRQYLTICLPLTIETDINATVTVFQQTGTVSAPVVDSTTVPATVKAVHASQPPPVIIRANVPPPPPPPIAQQIGNPLTDLERKSISLSDGQAFQRMLCVDDTGNFGPAGSPTRLALKEFFAARLYPRDASAPDTIVNTNELRQLRDSQAIFPSCRSAGLLNAYEVGLFSRPVSSTGGVDPMKVISQVGDALTSQGIVVPTQFQSATLTPAVVTSLRQVIPQLRTKYSLPGDAALDRALYNKIVRSAAN
jgi:hypothetical protein